MRPECAAPAYQIDFSPYTRYQVINLSTFGFLFTLGSGRESGDDLDNRPKHSEGISCRPKQECEGLESEERLRQFKCVYYD